MKPRLHIRRGLASRRGFSLVEVSLALGIAGFCLLALYGLIPVGVNSNQISLNQTVAANLATAVLSDLKCAQPLGAGTSPRFGFSIPAAGSTNSVSVPQTVYLAASGSATTVGATPVTSGTSPSLYRATLGFAPPGAGQRTATAVRILITWPALADSAPGTWPQNYTGSYEADTTLNRN